MPKESVFSRKLTMPKPSIGGLLESLAGRVAFLLAIPVALYEFLRKHDTIRKIVFFWAIGLPVIHLLFPNGGIATVLAVLGFVLQFVYAILFMVIQFGSLFWFMGRTRSTEIHPGDPKNITWDDYWGQDYLVERVQQWNKLLTYRAEFARIGGQALNGLLMDGPPGTGKTMMAKALAGSGGVAFLGVEGSTFRGMFWGMDTMKVMGFVGKARKLARRYGACIAYIDEIDAVASSRGSVQQGGQQQLRGYGGMVGMMGSGALTRLLYEMDGIEELGLFDSALNRTRQFFGLPILDRGKVMFMGATNRPDVLDPAVLRPGRFDQIIHVGLPDEQGREAIIRGYLGRVIHDDDIDIEALVADTPRATPAHIMSVITKDAPRAAIFDGRSSISQDDLELGFQEKLIGIANPIGNWDEEQKRAVAAHESGHTLASLRWTPKKRLVRVSIIRRGSALGYVLDVNRVDIYAHPQSDWINRILVSVAGDIGAKIVMGERWTGMGGDLLRVRSLIEELWIHGVFGSFPLLSDGSPDEEVKKAVDRFMREVVELVEGYLRKQEPALLALTGALAEREDMTGEEAKQIIEAAEGVDDGKES